MTALSPFFRTSAIKTMPVIVTQKKALKNLLGLERGLWQQHTIWIVFNLNARFCAYIMDHL